MWPYMGIAVSPEKGDGIFWYNLLRRNAIDIHSNHKACSVLLGGKWICNKWIGYNQQWKNENQNCALTKDVRFYPSFNKQIL